MNLRPLPTVAFLVGAIFVATLAGDTDGLFGRSRDSLDLVTTAAGERTVQLVGFSPAEAERLVGPRTVWGELRYRASEARVPFRVERIRLGSEEASDALAGVALTQLPTGTLILEGETARIPLARPGEARAIEITQSSPEGWVTRLIVEDGARGDDAVAAFADRPPPLVPGVAVELGSGERVRVLRRGVDPLIVRDAGPEPLVPAPDAVPGSSERPLFGVRVGGDVADARRLYGTEATRTLFGRLVEHGVGLVALDVRISAARPGLGVGLRSTVDFGVQADSLTLEGDGRVRRAVAQARALGLRVVLCPTLVTAPSGDEVDRSKGFEPGLRNRVAAGLMEAIARFAAEAGADDILLFGPRSLPVRTADDDARSVAAVEREAELAAWRVEVTAAAAAEGLGLIALAGNPVQLSAIAGPESGLPAVLDLAVEVSLGAASRSKDAAFLTGAFAHALGRAVEAAPDRLALVLLTAGSPAGLEAAAAALDRVDDAPTLVVGRWYVGPRGETHGLGAFPDEAWAPLEAAAERR